MGDLPSPSEATMLRHARQLNKMLFQGHNFKYKLTDLAHMLNKVSRFAGEAVPWGDAMMGIYSLRDVMMEIGVRETEEMQNAKKILIASVMTIDEFDHTPTNRPLLNALLPHVTQANRSIYISECLDRRLQFDLFGDAQQFSYDIVLQKRNSKLFHYGIKIMIQYHDYQNLHRKC